MKSFGIITISHGRDSVLRLFCASIRRLRYELDMYVPCVIVGDAEHKEICDEYKVVHIPQENIPVPAKWNRAVEYAINQGWQYIVISGSDDILSTQLIRNLQEKMELGYDLIGVKEVYFYCGDGRYKGQIRRLDIHQGISGVARTISRKIFEKAHPMWKKNAGWGMDGDCLRNITQFIETQAKVEGLVFDIKTRENLNKFTLWMQRSEVNYPQETFLNILSEEEKQILQTL